MGDAFSVLLYPLLVYTVFLTIKTSLPTRAIFFLYLDNALSSLRLHEFRGGGEKVAMRSANNFWKNSSQCGEIRLQVK